MQNAKCKMQKAHSATGEMQSAHCTMTKVETFGRITLGLLIACSVTAGPLFAQPRTQQARAPQRRTMQPRVFVSINAVYRGPSRTLTDSTTFQTPFSAGRELGSATSTYKVPTGVMFDGGGIARLWHGLGAGVAVSAFTSRNDFNITAQMPHPFFFNQMRTIEGTVNARHAETTVHVLGAYYVPLTPRLNVIVSAGPSHFSVEQKLVRSVTAIELYPFDTAQFGTADLEVFNTTAWGFNAGADLSWMFSRNFGVGGLVRFAKATIELTPTGRAAVKMDAGGFQAGGGVRIGF